MRFQSIKNDFRSVPKNADFLSQKNFSFNSNLFMKVFLDLEPKLLFFVLPLHWTKGLSIHKIDEFAHFQKSIKSTYLNMSKINFLFLEVNLVLFRWPFNQDSSWFLHSIFSSCQKSKHWYSSTHRKFIFCFWLHLQKAKSADGSCRWCYVVKLY